MLRSAITIGRHLTAALFMSQCIGIATVSAQPFTTIYNVPGDVPPEPLPPDTQLNLFEGGSLGNNYSVSSGSETNIYGGTVGRFFVAGSGSEVNVTGGVLGDLFTAWGDQVIGGDGSTVNISGGTFGKQFTARINSTVSITGGVFGDFFDADIYSNVNIGGGVFGNFVDVLQFSVVNITGGSIDVDLDVFPNSTLNLFGTSFKLDGVDLVPSMVYGQPITITDRDVPLEVVLVDGSNLHLDLFSDSIWSFLDHTNGDYVDPSATITITLVPQSGDLDGDGFVGIADLTLVLGNWNQSVPPANPLADPSGDGFIGIDDLNTVLANWNAGTPPPSVVPIPEPSGAAILMFCGLVNVLSRSRRCA